MFIPSNTCPSCGYCPHCGRGGHQAQPFYPYQPIWISMPNTGGLGSPGTFTLGNAGGIYPQMGGIQFQQGNT